MTLLARITDQDQQSLTAHTEDVAESCRRLVERAALNFEGLSGKDLAEVAEIIGASHDFGKGTTYFQRYIAPDTTYSGREKQHASLSAYFAYDWLTTAGYDDSIALLGWLVVQRHHGDLTDVFGKSGELQRKAEDPDHRRLLSTQACDIEEHTLDLLAKVYESWTTAPPISEFLSRVKSGTLPDRLEEHLRSGEPGSVERYYLLLYLYSVLLDADKMDSAGVDFREWPSVGENQIADIDSDAVDNYKTTNLSQTTALDERRERAGQFVEQALRTLNQDNRLLSLTMPTGSGKTLTALNAALQLRTMSDFERPPRIIYAAPFLSIIDQNHDVVTDVLEAAGIEPDPSTLLRHDHASGGYADADTDNDSSYYRNPQQALLLTEGWNAEIITTTFVQFFQTLITHRNTDARRFHKLANSIVLLDEIQAVPTKYWAVIREGLRVLTEVFNGYVILMTATNPLIFDTGEITELATNDRPLQGLSYPDFDQLDRVTFQFDTDPKSVEDLVDSVITSVQAEPTNDVMVILNTISSTREVYERLLNRVDREVVYLSTRILPRDRHQRIKRIKTADEPLLIVTTQLVEAGVDIDIDTIYRDFAPVDSLVQTAGRCNREGQSGRGTVRVVRLQDDRDTAARTFYHQYVYDPVLTDATERVLSEYPESVTETEFTTSATTAYFEQVNARKATHEAAVIPAMHSLECDEVAISLIDEDYQTVPIFIEANNNATDVYETVRDIYDSYENYARQGKMQEIKGEFYSYIVNAAVPGNENELSALPTTFTDGIRLVTQDKIGRNLDRHWYHPEIGFQIPESTVDSRIL